jgi:hypothetical protein
MLSERFVSNIESRNPVLNLSRPGACLGSIA